MPSSKHSRKSRKTKSFQYGHKYRSLEICEGDTSTAAGLKACIRRLKWMNDDFLYRVDKEGKRGKMKNKKALNLCLETQCDDRIKELAKCNLYPFIKRLQSMSDHDVAKFLNAHLKATKITYERLRFWKSSVGYSCGAILELIHERSFALGEELQTSIGEWNTLYRIYGKVLRGEWVFEEEESDEDEDSASSNDNQMRVISKRDKKKLDKYKKKKQKKAKAMMDICSDSSDDGGAIDTDDGGGANDNQTHPVERKENETTSNCFQRGRTLARNPFFAPIGFYGQALHSIDLSQVESSQVIESSRGDKYWVNDSSNWFENDVKLMFTGLLYEHRCTKLHQSMISQGALIQNVFRNRIIGDKKLSVSPVVQYLIFTTFAEHAKIIYRFKTEGGAWEKNKQLMTEALEANGDDCEYKIGLWDVHYEGKTRIPRAPQQMNEKKRGNACTEYYVRLNPVRIAAHYQGNDLAEWQKIEGIWKKFGVDRILHEYLTRFFPGNEEKAMDLGILKVDNMQGKDAFRKQKKKENDEMLSFI
eukprot:155943_1